MIRLCPYSSHPHPSSCPLPQETTILAQEHKKVRRTPDVCTPPGNVLFTTFTVGNPYKRMPTSYKDKKGLTCSFLQYFWLHNFYISCKIYRDLNNLYQSCQLFCNDFIEHGPINMSWQCLWGFYKCTPLFFTEKTLSRSRHMW